MPEDVARIVSRHRNVWTVPPSRTPADHSVDGPLLGNGDMGVAIGGGPAEQRFFLCKNDLWRLKSQAGQSSPVGFGSLAIRIGALKDASYEVVQDLWAAETAATFETDSAAVRMRSIVAATRNLFILELATEGSSVETEAMLRVASGRGSASVASRRGDIAVGQRSFVDDVDIPSGVAVAWRVIGADTADAQRSRAPSRTEPFRVQIGREQWGGGRWGFEGQMDDLRLYDRALGEEAAAALAKGSVPDGAVRVWPTKELPEDSTIRATDGRDGDAWQFSGDTNCYLDCGPIPIPIESVTVACWIKIDATDPAANYILSCGEWNKGVSLGLSAGKLRFSVTGRYIESAVLPTGEWLHVAGTWDGGNLAVYVNGERVERLGNGAVSAGVRFTLTPGRPVTLVLAMASVFQSPDYAGEATNTVSAINTPADLADVRRNHTEWWADYWSKSYVEIGDPAVEAAYYRSLYGMGAASRDPQFPPGIFGWNTTDSPRWAGDYHLNYNHMAPFYALYAANRIEQADPQDAPLLAFRERGRWYAENVTKTRGVLYPVGIGPLGIETTRRHGRYSAGPNSEQGGLFFQQRSNSAYCLVNIAQRWRGTYDPAYGKAVYPFVKDVAEFWEDYLKWEDDRYVIHGDAIHEGSGQDVNPILSLGLVRSALDLVLDMSSELGADTDRREKWQHVLDNLSEWTTQELDGKAVFRYSETGTPWWRNNTLGIQHIYPGDALGLGSDPRWIEVAHNTIDVMQRWLDGNGSNSFFPAAVRVGYNPGTILDQLRHYTGNTYPNGFQRGNPHGIENLSTVPNTINEMLCMSHVPAGSAPGTQLLRVFPVWPRDRDARFAKIRARGAFLVSAELRAGDVRYVNILSERGRDCAVLNPWPGQEAKVTRNGHPSGTVAGERFLLTTSPGETLVLRPAARR